MLELDLLLLPFFDNNFMELTDAQKHTFVKLLEQDDPDLLSWFSQNSRPADRDLADMVDTILAGHRTA